MRKFWIVLALLALSGCTGGNAATGGNALPSATTTMAVSAATRMSGGCADTPLWTGSHPDWTASARLPDSRYVLSHDENVVGVLFGDSLRAGPNVTDPANKILWVVREPREGKSLSLTLRRVDGTGESVTQVEPANSGPGEIYPSIVDVPTAGCWTVQAAWNGHTATLELNYV